MSLVGSSVQILSKDGDGSPMPLGVVASGESMEEEDEDHTSYHDMVSAYQDGDDAHPPPTPPGAAEALFMSGLNTHHISAAALAEQIHLRHRPLSFAGTSIATDDFASATDAINSSMLVEHDPDDDHIDAPFGNDALLHTREALIIEEETTSDRNMSTKKTTTKTTSTTKDMHVDAAEKIYDTAKGVWGWGKGIIIFSPFMGIAEGIAGKIVETAGSNLDDLDMAVLDKLHGLDDGILNPAIAKIVETLLGAKDGAEGFVGPILESVLKPLGLLKDKPESESTLKPNGSTAM